MSTKPHTSSSTCSAVPASAHRLGCRERGQRGKFASRAHVRRSDSEHSS
ncbi:hypothetical protein [Rhodococcus sp. PSBB049]|nr:hypothetical protein [Rhodococcus sp. PSBB049]